MRPDVQSKGILIANIASQRLKSANSGRGIEVKTFSVEELLAMEATPMADKSRRRYPDFGAFSGFDTADFAGILEADKTLDPEKRRSSIGKLYQIRDFLLPRLQEEFPGVYLDTKVSDRQKKNRLDVPWMAYYFGARAEGNTPTPHVNITLAEVSETGTLKPSECSVHLNAELKPGFTKVLQALRKATDLAPLWPAIQGNGFELRIYSKVPVQPQNTNDNFWNLRASWPIDHAFHPEHVVSWFDTFTANNAGSLLQDIQRIDSIHGKNVLTAFAKSNFRFSGNESAPRQLSAEGRCVFRLGRWWEPAEAIALGPQFQDSLLGAITQLSPFFELFQ
jgi:hypothetical protein